MNLTEAEGGSKWRKTSEKIAHICRQRKRMAMLASKTEPKCNLVCPECQMNASNGQRIEQHFEGAGRK